MSSDTPADPPPWQQGPPPGYTPPAPTPDPTRTAAAHERGRAACIAAIEDATGKTKTDRGWIPRAETDEGEH